MPLYRTGTYIHRHHFLTLITVIKTFCYCINNSYPNIKCTENKISKSNCDLNSLYFIFKMCHSFNLKFPFHFLKGTRYSGSRWHFLIVDVVLWRQVLYVLCGHLSHTASQRVLKTAVGLKAIHMFSEHSHLVDHLTYWPVTEIQS